MNSLGSRYASALLSIAVDENKNSEYREYVKEVYKVLEQDDGLIKLLNSANITKDEKKDIVSKVFKNCPFESIVNLMKVIVDNGRALYIKEILKDFITLSNTKDNISEGFIYSAQPLEEKQINSISNAISKKIGKQVYLMPRIDEELIGGFKVVINDYVFDTSVKNQIEGLKSSLLERR